MLFLEFLWWLWVVGSFSVRLRRLETCTNTSSNLPELRRANAETVENRLPVNALPDVPPEAATSVIILMMMMMMTTYCSDGIGDDDTGSFQLFGDSVGIFYPNSKLHTCGAEICRYESEPSGGGDSWLMFWPQLHVL